VSVRLYMDVHIPYAITTGLRLRDVDVLTAQEDGAAEYEDSALLDRATELGRVLFTYDDDLLEEAAIRQHKGHTFVGGVYARQLDVTIGQCVDDLELIGKACDPSEWLSRVEYLPLK